MKTKDNLIKMKIILTEEQYRKVILKEETQNKFNTILLFGPQGVGKSTIADKLGKKLEIDLDLDVPVIASDDVIDQGDWSAEETWEKGWQKRKENEYKDMVQYLEKNLGEFVILDVGGSHGVWEEKHINTIKYIVSKYPNRFLILPSKDIETSKKILRARMLEREKKFIIKTIKSGYWDEMLKGNKDFPNEKNFDADDKKYWDEMVSGIIAKDEGAIKKAQFEKDKLEKRLRNIEDPNKQWIEFTGVNKGKHEFAPHIFTDYTQYFIDNMEKSGIANHIIDGTDNTTIVNKIMDEIDIGYPTKEEWREKWGFGPCDVDDNTIPYCIRYIIDESFLDSPYKETLFGIIKDKGWDGFKEMSYGEFLKKESKM